MIKSKLISILAIIFTILLLNSCTSLINGNKKDIQNLESRITELENKINDNNNNKVIENSFKVNITHFGGIYSSIYDGVFWPISSINELYPSYNSAISDIKKSGINITFPGNKYYLSAECPNNFYIKECNIDSYSIENYGNKCNFYLDENNNKNSNINFICDNGNYIELF